MELNVSLFLLLVTCSFIASQPNSDESENGDIGMKARFRDDEYDSQLGKRFSNFVRIGRPSSFVRIGKSATDTDSSTEKAFETPNKRQSSFVRIGKGLSSFVRIGKNVDTAKRMSNFVRIGKSMLTEPEKRLSRFVRIGKSEAEKRAFVRIGKIPSSAFVRIGRMPLYDAILERPSDFLRLGRMAKSSFVRIGKRDNEK